VQSRDTFARLFGGARGKAWAQIHADDCHADGRGWAPQGGGPGLLLNFGPKAQFERLVYSNSNKPMLAAEW